MPRLSLILRKTPAATVSPERAEELVCLNGCGAVRRRDGDNLLVDLEPAELARLKDALDGWVVAEQGVRIGVPDTRRSLKPSG